MELADRREPAREGARRQSRRRRSREIGVQRRFVGGFEGNAADGEKRRKVEQIGAIGGECRLRGTALRGQHFEKCLEMAGGRRNLAVRPHRPGRHLGKRESGSTFSTGAEGADGFHSARNAAPPSAAKMMTATKPMVSFPIPLLACPQRRLFLPNRHPDSPDRVRAD